jgi:pimeloyl-ACP methyl ester carboxylesterase
MKAIQVNGAVLATESFGEATKGTILLVMGATASMVWWPTGFCEALAAAGYRVIRFDHRDTGASTTGAPGEVIYDLADIAQDILAIMDGYDVVVAHLVGMSLGGLAAQLLAAQQSERVPSLTLIAAEPLGLTYEGEGIAPKFLEHFSGMATLDWNDHNAVRAFMVTIAELSAGSAPPFDLAAASARVEEELSRTSNMQSAFNHAMIQGELPKGVTAERIGVPVLILHGTEDPIISPKAAERSAGAIKGARLVLLEGRGHELATADLERISAEILAHVSAERVA